jgi:hypothetical protein
MFGWPGLTPKLFFQAIISLLILVACLSIIMGQYESGSKNWAFGIVGSILGYWFKGR